MVHNLWDHAKRLSPIIMHMTESPDYGLEGIWNVKPFFNDVQAFFIKNAFLAQAQMLLSEIQNSLKLTLPYLTKRC